MREKPLVVKTINCYDGLVDIFLADWLIVLNMSVFPQSHNKDGSDNDAARR